VNRVTLINLDGPFAPTPEAPAALVVDGHLRGTKRIVPTTYLDGEWLRLVLGNYQGPLGNGEYVNSSDGRFNFGGPVTLHDRYERFDIFEALSQ
jgi:hypothetical protein